MFQDYLGTKRPPDEPGPRKTEAMEVTQSCLEVETLSNSFTKDSLRRASRGGHSSKVKT